MAAGRADRTGRPTQPVQVVHARLVVREPRPQFGVRPRVVQAMRRHETTLRKYGLVGHLFQGPYKSRYVGSAEHLAIVSRYIHRNPAKFTDIRTYRWSSYRQYLGTRAGIADPGPVLAMFESKDSYATFVESALTPEMPRYGEAGRPRTARLSV
jgi:hypothetical protein